MIPFNVP